MKINQFLWCAAMALWLSLSGCGGGGGGGATVVQGSTSPLTATTPPVASVTLFGPTLTAPNHLVFLGADLYVADQTGIQVLNPAGTTTHAYPATNAVGLGVQSGRVYHTGHITNGQDTLFEVGSLSPLLAYSANNFDGIAFYGSNMLFAANSSNVLAYTNFLNPLVISGFGATPMALAADTAQARVYLTLDNNRMGYLNPSNLSAGLTVLTQTSPATWGPLMRPNGVAVSALGFAYVANQGDANGSGGYISKINTTTGATEVLMSDSVGDWGTVPVGFCGLRGVALDNSGENLYVTNASCLSSYAGYGNHGRILKIKLP